MIDSFPKPEDLNNQTEHIPTAEEVHEVFKRLVGKEYKETKIVEDELGLYLLRVETPGNSPSDMREYEYRRKKNYTENEPSLTEISITYYSDDIPTAGQNIAKFASGKWEISIGVYPDMSMEDLQIRSLDEINYDISHATADQRKILFERLATEPNEKLASEALEINQPFSVEEQELLVSMISDPQMSSEVLTIDHANKLTEAQADKLMEQMLSDEEVAYSVYINLIESGIEPDEIEKSWIERIEKSLAKTNNPDIASYLLEHSTFLTEEDRKRMEKII